MENVVEFRRRDPEQANVEGGGHPAGVRGVAPAPRAARLAVPDETRELAFELWAYRANRSVATTMKLLAEEVGADEVPSRRTVERWRRDHDWDGEVTRRLRATAPALMEQYAARFFELVGLAQDVIADGLTTDKRDGSVKPGIFAAMQMQARDQQAAYLEMVQQGIAAKLAADAQQVSTADEKDPNERARQLRDRIARENRGR